MSNFKEAISKIRIIADALPDDDPDKIEMMNIEGDYSNLMEWALRKRNEYIAQSTACKDLQDLYAKRKKSFDCKSDNMKELAGMILTQANERKFTGINGTVSLTKKPQGVMVLDEALIPERFFKTERKLDKTALNNAVKGGEVIEGAALDNGGETITIRV